MYKRQVKYLPTILPVKTAGRSDFLIIIPSVVSQSTSLITVSYTHLRAHETVLDLVCRLLLEKKNKSCIGGVLHRGIYASS